jgi:hypothetical protein
VKKVSQKNLLRIGSICWRDWGHLKGLKRAFTQRCTFLAKEEEEQEEEQEERDEKVCYYGSSPLSRLWEESK